MLEIPDPRTDFPGRLSFVEAEEQYRALRPGQPGPVPKQAAVYALLQKDRVWYVGQTADLMLRLGQHRAKERKWRETGGWRWDAMVWLPAESYAERVCLEAALVALLRPPRNQRILLEFVSGKVIADTIIQRRGRPANSGLLPALEAQNENEV